MKPLNLLDRFIHKQSEVIIDYDEIRQEQLNSISQVIKQTRIEKNLEKDIISNQLHIPISILNAIESADLSQLPEPVFTRQLIKKYAYFLQLNGDEISDQFTCQLNAKKYTKKSQLKYFNLKFKLNIKPKHLYIFYFLLLFFSIKSLSTILESNQFNQTKIPRKEVIKTNINKTPVNNPPVNDTPKVIPIVEKKEEKPAIGEELMIKITVKQDSWVKITVDNKPAFEGILTKGIEKQWNGKQKIKIRAGNAGGILISVNNEKPKELGKLGQVQEATFELPPRS